MLAAELPIFYFDEAEMLFFRSNKETKVWSEINLPNSNVAWICTKNIYGVETRKPYRVLFDTVVSGAVAKFNSELAEHNKSVDKSLENKKRERINEFMIYCKKNKEYVIEEYRKQFQKDILEIRNTNGFIRVLLPSNTIISSQDKDEHIYGGSVINYHNPNVLIFEISEDDKKQLTNAFFYAE